MYFISFQWFSDLFGFERNMFDHVGHFVVGFYALPIIEYVYSRGIIKTKLVAFGCWGGRGNR